MRARLRNAGTAAAQGLLMGGADVVPGVSGGTMALIVGIYERLVGAIRTAASAPVALARGDLAGARAVLRQVEWGFVLPLAAGILTAIGVGSVVLPPLLESYPTEMSGVFFGLIAGSLAVPWRRIGRVGARHLVVAGLFAVAAFVLVGFPDREVVDPSLPRVAATAAVAICAMILPGVSGAFLLLVLGIYRPTLEAVRDLDVGYILVFGAGAAAGLGMFAKLLGWLLEHHHRMTMAALVGLMAGSLRALWPWQTVDRALLAPPAEIATAQVVGLAVAGFAAVTVLIRAGARRVPRPASHARRGAGPATGARHHRPPRAGGEGRPGTRRR